MPLDPQDGLAWEESLFDFEPRWTREPSLEAIECVCRQRLGVPAERPCTVVDHSVDLFSKLYLINCNDDNMLMRVLLPVSPRFKTRGEVATLRWVDEHTSIRVPKVIAFDDSNDNQIGFEWILMEHIPGVPANRAWRKMSMEQKSALTKRVAEINVQLACGRQFKGIGTLDFGNSPDSAEASTSIAPGKLISVDYFMRSRLKYDVPQGPFRNSHDWLKSQIRLIILEETEVSKTTEDEDEREDALENLQMAHRLLSFLPRVFPEDQEEAVPTALYHHDLHLENILVNENGEIATIMDWGCVSAMPLWLTAEDPRFLVAFGHQPEDEPNRDSYGDETPEERAERLENGDADELDNEGKTDLYWINLMEYEKTKLREVYEARVMELWPEFPLRESHTKIGFFGAVLQCSRGFLWLGNRWLDSQQE